MIHSATAERESNVFFGVCCSVGDSSRSSDLLGCGKKPEDLDLSGGEDDPSPHGAGDVGLGFDLCHGRAARIPPSAAVRLGFMRSLLAGDAAVGLALAPLGASKDLLLRAATNHAKTWRPEMAQDCSPA